MVERVRTRERVREPEAIPPKKSAIVRNSVPATVVTSVTKKTDGEIDYNAHNVQRFPVDVPDVHATVHVGGKVTWQPRDFESISVEVGIWFPCAPTEEAANQTYKATSEFVERKINREAAIARGEIVDETTPAS